MGVTGQKKKSLSLVFSTLRTLWVSCVEWLERTRKYCTHLFKSVQHVTTNEGAPIGSHIIRISLPVALGTLHWEMLIRP